MGGGRRGERERGRFHGSLTCAEMDRQRVALIVNTSNYFANADGSFINREPITLQFFENNVLNFLKKKCDLSSQIVIQ